jgi:uncharacterized repeat protein (TIGR01451 family)/uncharacterized protein (TIGR03382 family)
MGTLRILARASATAFVTATAFLAGPSLAQVVAQHADLAVTFPPAPPAGTPATATTVGVVSFAGFVPVTDKNGDLAAPTALSFGKTIKYIFTVANNGPNHATGVGVNITPPTGTSVTAVSGATCAKDADGNLDLTKPCAIAADMENGATPVNVTVTVKLDVPKTAPATCPGGTALGTFTAVVVTDANTTDIDTSNNTATVAGTGVALDPYTDVGVTLDGPTSGVVGQSVTYTGTVTNKGPCPADNVAVAFTPGTLLTFQSGTGTCGTVDVANGCTIGTMAPGQTVTFTNTFKIASLPDSVTQTTIPNELDITTDTTDVNSDNDSAILGAGGGPGLRVGKEGGGCSSGGPGGLVAVLLMGAAVFAARRRRTA